MRLENDVCVHVCVCVFSIYMCVCVFSICVCVCGKEVFYLTTHSTHFIYGYMASDIW